MNDSELKALISAHSFVQGMRSEHLKILLDCAHAATFEAGDIIFKEGEPANEFYLVEQGKIDLEAHELAGDTVHIETVGPDEALGWSWLLPPYVWHFRSRAIEPTTVIALNGARLLVRAEQDHDFGYELMKRVAKILMHRLQSTRRGLLGHHTEVLWHA